MPKMNIDEPMAEFNTPAAYKFSGVPADEIGASEQTLVTIIQDVSGSVTRFADDMTDCLKTILKACQKDPRSENLMLRLALFNDRMTEAHGFRFLSGIDPDEYDGILQTGGTTALYESTHEAIEATVVYGEDLVDHDLDVNAVVFIITDGENNEPGDVARIKKLLDDVRSSEKIESILVILVGITKNNVNLQNHLDQFKTDADLDSFIDIVDATPATLAKLAKFVSQSISSQSQSLGTGGPSQTLTF